MSIYEHVYTLGLHIYVLKHSNTFVHCLLFTIFVTWLYLLTMRCMYLMCPIGRKAIFQVHMAGLTLDGDMSEMASRLAALTPGFTGMYVCMYV